MPPAVAPPAMPPQQYAAPQAYAPQAGYAAPALVYAGFWMRLGAYLLDILILIIPMSLLGFVPGINILAAFVGPWLYFALQESSERQATLGKMALKIYVTDLQGQRISFGKATGRHFGRILCALTLCIGYMMAGFTAQKQGLHDMIAGTLVKRR